MPLPKYGNLHGTGDQRGVVVDMPEALKKLSGFQKLKVRDRKGGKKLGLRGTKNLKSLP